MRRSFRSALIAGLAAAALAGCANEPELASMSEAGGGAAGAGAGLAGSVDDPTSAAYFTQVVGDRVFFATDSASLSTDALETLSRQARWLQDNPGVSVAVEGHADERGTRDYNLALGARRAQAARDFLMAEGVASDRIRAVSFGKERPVALCSDESCWSRNRRAVTVVAGAPVS